MTHRFPQPARPLLGLFTAAWGLLLTVTPVFWVFWATPLLLLVPLVIVAVGSLVVMMVRRIGVALLLVWLGLMALGFATLSTDTDGFGAADRGLDLWLALLFGSIAFVVWIPPACLLYLARRHPVSTLTD